MKALALVLALTLTAAAVMAGGGKKSGGYKGHGGGGGGYDDDDVDVRAKPVEDFKGKVQELNLCECDATNAFVSVFDGKIGEDPTTKYAYIEFKFILDNSLLSISDEDGVRDLGVAMDVHGACDDCNDLIVIQDRIGAASDPLIRGGVFIVPDGGDCDQALGEDQLKGTLRVYFRDGAGQVATTNTGGPPISPVQPALTLAQVLARTNGRFFAQIFLITFNPSTFAITRYACASVTGTITPKSCAGNKWGIGPNNICAGTQCSRGPKQRLGRAVGQAKTFDCCDDTDVFGCCAAAGKSDPSTCAALNTHHRCGPDAWKCDLSTTYGFAKQRNVFTSVQCDWTDHERTESFGKSSAAGRNSGASNSRFSDEDSDRSNRGGGGERRRGDD